MQFFVVPMFSPLTDGARHPAVAIAAITLALWDSSFQFCKGCVPHEAAGWLHPQCHHMAKPAPNQMG